MADKQNKKKKITIDEEGVKWFNCEFENCQYKTKHPSNLIAHEKDEHSVINTRYMCSGCLYKLKTKEYLKQHVERAYDESTKIFGYILCYGESGNIILYHIFSLFLLFHCC